MSRQEKRRKARQQEPKFKWDIVAIYAILVFFAATALYAYFFPQINARAYASGPRVQKIIITRAMDKLTKKISLEFIYSYSHAKAEDTVQYQVKEEGNKITLTDTETKETFEYSAGNSEYRTVAQILDDIRAALKTKGFKIAYIGNDVGYYTLQVRNTVSATEFEGYDLYFTAQHELDIIHYYKTGSKDEVLQRVYSGLTTGIVIPDGSEK